MLKEGGMFKEFGRNYGGESSILSMVRAEPQTDEDKIIIYLSSGNNMFVTDYVYDIIQPSDNPIDNLEILTDGVWMWRNDYAYYVNKYHVVVEPEFKQHMILNNWKCPKMTDAEITELIRREDEERKKLR